MDLVVWNDAFLLGIPALDEDHRKVVNYLNRLNSMVREGAPGEQVLAVLDELIGHLREHFAREDHLAFRVLTPQDRLEHERNHREALRQFEGFRARLGDDAGAPQLNALLHYLHGWLVHHVFDQDHAMRKDLVAAGIVKDTTSRAGLMERLMDRFQIRTRVFAIALVPTLALTAVSGMAIKDSRDVALQMEMVEDLTGLARVLSGLVHELQKERGLTSGYLSSGDPGFVPRIGAQREETDARIADARASLTRARDLGMGAQADGAAALLERLGAMRDAISARQVAAGDAVGFYTDLNRSLIGVVATMGQSVTHPEVARALTAYVSLLRGKEAAGLERATGAAGFGAGRFAPEVHRRFVSLMSEQKAYLDLFRSSASPTTASQADAHLAGAAVGAVERLREIALDSLATGNVAGVTAGQWFEAATARIDQLKAVEDRAAADMNALAEGLHGGALDRLMALLVASGALVALTLLMAYVLIGSINRPLAALRRSLQRLAEGDNSVTIYGQDKRDLIGDIARDVHGFKLHIIRAGMDAAKGGFEQSMRDRGARERERLTAEFQRGIDVFLDAVSQSVRALEASATTMVATMQSGRAQAASVAAAATQATGNVETVAAAVEEMSASVREIASQTSRSAQVAEIAAASAVETKDTVGSLADGAARIGAIVAMIKEIADRTNLLALNATIEAARAGEAGKGFAVVASEVKALANQTGRATEEITGQVAAIQGATAAAAASITRVAEVVGEMSGTTASVASAVEQQDATTKEIAGNIEQAAHGTRDVSSNIVGVAQDAERASELASSVAMAAKAVAGEAERLRERVKQFLEKVAA